MDGKPSIKGPLEKAGRARTHLQALYDEINAFNDPNPYEVVDKTDVEGRKYEAWIKVHREPPEFAWGLLLGDFVHNLRGALDHLVGQLVLLSGKKRIGGQSQFPIAFTGIEYWSPGKDGKPSMRDRMLAGVSEEYRAVIDEAQPYRAGNAAAWHAFAVLHWLSNVDKHRLIHPAWALLEEPTMDSFEVVSTDEAGLAEIEIQSGPLQDGAKILSASFQTTDPNAQVHMKGDFPIDIAFGARGAKGEGIASRHLGPILIQAERLIKTFASTFIWETEKP